MVTIHGEQRPSLLSILSKASDRSTQGGVQGLAGSVSATAAILGLLAGGLAFGRLSAAVFLVAVGMTALVFLLSIGIPKERAALSPAPGVTGPCE